MSKKMDNKKNVNDNNFIPAANGSRGSEKGPGLLAYVPAFCSLLGTLILLTVIAAALPLTVPGFMGYKIYNVVSGSMEPAIPVGSIVYVKDIDPSEVNTGDIIAFEGGDSVIMHRVQENKVVEGSFVTRGDANDSEDLAEVPYDRLIGIVVRHIPILGQILTLFGTSFGRICMVCFAACGALLNILGARLRDALKYAREEEAAGS